MPTNLYGNVYTGKLATLLANAAQSHNFVSPIWTTKEGFAKIGVTVLNTDNNSNNYEGNTGVDDNGAVTVPVNYLNGLND